MARGRAVDGDIGPSIAIVVGGHRHVGSRAPDVTGSGAIAAR